MVGFLLKKCIKITASGNNACRLLLKMVQYGCEYIVSSSGCIYQRPSSAPTLGGFLLVATSQLKVFLNNIFFLKKFSIVIYIIDHAFGIKTRK